MSIQQPLAVDIHREDDGELCLVFGAGLLVSDLRAALDELPGDSVLSHLCVLYFCHEEECSGQDLPDEDHDLFVCTLSVEPPELPAAAEIPATPEGLQL